MIRFQCPHCRGLVAADSWEPGADTVCAYCSKEVPMPMNRLEPGAVLGDFLLVRKLGAGGMGIVFLAHQLSLDRPAAIKVLNPEFSSEAESVKAFITEARSAAKLNHPNIVQAYAVGEEEGLFYFAMEFINGQTMKEVLAEKKKIEPRMAADIIMQVAEALDCAWREQKLIHHDIKPDNIMQCANDRVKLADLGLAQVFGEDANDDSDEVIGTPQYISPEQLTGVVTDTRSDIYSLGATFYHLVTGQFPYNGENTEEIAKQHVFGTLNPPRNVNPMLPQVLNDIIVKMMAKDPNGRFQDCRELAKALKNYLEKGESSGGLTGGLMGGGSSGHSSKLGDGSAKPTLTLNGGMSAGGGVQPKLSAPANPIKLSIRGVQKEEPKPEAEKAENAPAEAPATPETAEASAVTETPAPAAPKITLNLPNKNVQNAPQKTELSPAAAEEKPEPAPESKSETAPVAEEEKNPAADADKSADKPAEKADSENSSDDKQEDDGKNSEESPAEKGSKSKKVLLIVIALIVLLAAAGGAYYWFVMKPQAEKTPVAEAPVKKQLTLAEQLVAEGQKVKVEVQETAPEVVEQSVAPETPAAPRLSAFMQRAKQLEELSLTNEASFLSQWPKAAAALQKMARSAEEKSMYDSLAVSYIDIDERRRVVPVRDKLLAAYNSSVANIEKRADVSEHIARIRTLEAEALKKAESSPENYAADLPRKMSLLDYAMISAAKNPRTWSVFKKALDVAKAEPQRVAGREGFADAAQQLADYAARLELVAEQGRNFTALIRKNSYKNKKISNLPILRDKMDKWIAEQDILVKDKKNKYSFAIDWDSLTVVSANYTNMRLTVKLLVTREPKIPPKPRKPAKGKKAKPPAPVKPVPVLVTVNISMAKNNGTMAIGRNRVFSAKTAVFKDITLEEMNGWLKAFEAMMGKDDQYFYYMLFNGNLKNRLSVIAPDKFWMNRVDRVARGYFKRCIQLANDAQLAALKKQYGTWLSFKHALEEVEAEK